ncbi:unnamed protein product [Hydatigera taeniaeformis]|uniref:Xpo1 domain-containing protein n=1 Tax=Hydatigena taeniaeformis TaxID=6205 RepID=A0A158RDC1_HYDTA|nr:unnamed protein product [Hydatigera taeniaeformis]
MRNADNILNTIKSILSEASISASLNSSLLPPTVIQMPPRPALPALCVAIMSAALSGFASPRIAVHVALLRLLNTSVDLFLGCTHVGIADHLVSLDFLNTLKPPPGDFLPTQNVTPGFDDVMELWGIMLSTYARDWRSNLYSSDALEGRRQQNFEHSRCAYVGLLRALFRLLSALWTPESCAFMLPSITSFELSLGLLDCHLVHSAATAASKADAIGLSAYVRFLDPEIFLLRRRLVDFFHVTASAVAFVRGLYSLQEVEKPALEDLMKQAINGLGAVEFFFESYIPKFVKLLSEIPLIVEESICSTLMSQGRPYLLMLLAHPLDGVRRVTYAQILDVISTNISIDLAADPTSHRYKSLTFLLTPEILGEIVEFGLQDSVPEIVSSVQTCLRILLDAHQLIPQPMWLLLVNLLVESPHKSFELNCLLTSSDWCPLKPLLSLGIAPLTTSCDSLLAERVLDACQGVSGFAGIHSIPVAPLLPLLYLPLSTTRLKAAGSIARILRTNFHPAKEVIEVVTSIEETLGDLLFVVSEAKPSVKEIISQDFIRHLSMVMDDFGECGTALVNALELVTDEVATVEVRRSAGEQVLAIITSPVGLTYWHEVGGPTIITEWISTLPSAMGQTLAGKLLIEPVVRIQLAIVQFVVTYDFDSRVQLYLNQSTCLLPLLFIGLCFWKVDEIRRCVSAIIALVIFTPAIRTSDESPVCLPQAITRSFCLPFVCPIYCLQSRHRIERPDFSNLLNHLTNARALFVPPSQRTRLITVAVIRALRAILGSLLEKGDALTIDPILNCTTTESVIVEATQLSSAIPRVLQGIRTSSSHAEASMHMSHLHLLAVVFWRSPARSMVWWHKADLARFLHALPSCTDDYRLLMHCLQTLTNLDFSPPCCNLRTIPSVSGAKTWNYVICWMPFAGFLYMLQMSKWILEEIMTTASPLAYLLLRFDAGVGATDSERLMEAKLTLHFRTLPRLFDALLACEDFLADIGADTLERSASVVSSDELCRLSDGFSALDFLFQWSLKVIELHANFLNEHIATLHTAVKILQRITLRTSWIAGVQHTDVTFGVLFQRTTYLISCILEGEKCARLHSGILYSSLALLHNALLLLTSEWRGSISSLDTYLISPWLSQLTHQRYSTEIRCLAVTLLAQAVLFDNFEEESIDIWNTAFSLLLNPTELPKVRAAAAHLLANLTARLKKADLSVDSGIFDSPLIPTFVDQQTQMRLFGTDAVQRMLEVNNFFSIMCKMLRNYYALPELSEETPKLCLNLWQDVEGSQNVSPQPNLCYFSTPLLISRICTFVGNLFHALPPDFILKNFEENQLCVALMRVINPKLLYRLSGSRENCRPCIMECMAQRHSASAFTQILRLFRLLFSISPQRKLTFLSDLRFLTLLSASFSCFSLDSADLRDLWKETMLFYIALLEPETEGSADFVLRHALRPLASQVHQWGPLIDQLIRRVVDLNRTSLTEGAACNEASRLTTFNLLYVALTFLSVVFSRCFSYTFGNQKWSNASGSSSTNSPLADPVSSALNSVASGQIAETLIILRTSFPHPRIDLDGVLLDSASGNGGDQESPHMFWQSEIHKQAVHSALKILFGTSFAAKKAALEGEMRISCLVLDIWPLGLTDNRVMHNLLYCLINLSADSSSVFSVIFTATTPAISSLCGEVSQTSPCAHPTIGMFFLFLLSPFL